MLRHIRTSHALSSLEWVAYVVQRSSHISSIGKRGNLDRYKIQQKHLKTGFADGCRLLSTGQSVSLNRHPASDNHKFYVTTPIFYVNSVPHIGHLYSALLADAINRWYQIRGVPTIFATGTDEHGLKIQQAAVSKGRDPAIYCKEISDHFRELFKAANVCHTDFIRTTEARHCTAVEAFWETLQTKGVIYKGTYEGWYSTSDEAFLTADQVTMKVQPDGTQTHVSLESGQPVDWMKEDNYLFKLSHFGPQLLQWLDKKVIQPAKFETLVRSWIEEGLPDLSVSRHRDRLHWGIPVPGDETQMIYVWLDALVNYLTVTGYPNERFVNFWPADCHIVGKDILRFHAVYWPAFLMAADLPLPHRILCHSHWLLDNQKMSKSRGNVVDPFDRLNKYGTDALRYFLLREGVPHSDGNYSDERLVERVNSELVNTLGNLLSRCTAPSLNPHQLFLALSTTALEQYATPQDRDMLQQLANLPALVDGHYQSGHIYKAVEVVMTQLRHTNNFVHSHAPWTIKNDPNMMPWLHTVLHVAMETLRVTGVLLSPVIPETCDKLLSRLGVPPEKRTWDHIKDSSVNRTVSGDTHLGPNTGILLPRIK